MDPRAYKFAITSRGLAYHYYFSQAHPGKQTILFLHGFPLYSYSWHYQVLFFQAKGYGIIAPDLLGYGGTDKPLDAESYRLKLMSNDLVEILDKENVSRAILVGHDWGSFLAARVANYHPVRVAAVAFLAIGYRPPSAEFDIYEINAQFEQIFGFQALGFWLFLSEEGAYRILEDHIDSLLSIGFTADPKQWTTNLCPPEALKAWLQSDRRADRAAYMTDEDLLKYKENLLRGGLWAPLCWYKAMVNGITPADEGDFTPETSIIQQPVLFGAGLQDFVAALPISKAIIEQLCPNATIVDFDTDHWVQLSAPEGVNAELLKWIEDSETPLEAP